MKKFLCVCLLALTALSVRAELNVFATVPEWGALVKEIGGDKVTVFTATNALQDPHRIEAKPSLLAQARRAQLVVAVGAELEMAWLPVVIRNSGNAAIQLGSPGYFEAANFVTRLEIPLSLDRAHGDIHAGGNPHAHLDPRNFIKVGQALVIRMAELDPENASAYQAGFKAFAEKWQTAITRWEREGAALKGLPVLVHHSSFTYLANWLGFTVVGSLEPKPGIEPTSNHLTALVRRQQSTPGRMVLRAAYNQDGPSQWISEKAQIPAVLLPYTVGGTPEAKDLTGLFDDTLSRLLKALH